MENGITKTKGSWNDLDKIDFKKKTVSLETTKAQSTNSIRDYTASNKSSEYMKQKFPE